VALAVRNDAEWARFVQLIGRPELAADERYRTLAARKANEEPLEAIVSEWTIGRSPEEATRILQEAAIPAFPSYSSKDIAEDLHLTDAGFFVRREHPEVGVRQHIGIPWRMTETPCEVRRQAPCLGEHTQYILGDLLNYAPETIRQLQDDGVLT